MAQIISRVASGSSLRVTLPSCASGLGIGTKVLTTDGSLPVEYLCPGDGIITHDAGLVRLAQISVRTVPLSGVVRLRPGCLSDDASDRTEIFLSARQKLVLRDWRARMIFGRPTALVAAGRLADGAYIEQLQGPAPLRLFQLGFEDGQHVLCLDHGLLAVSARRTPGSEPAGRVAKVNQTRV